MSATQDLDLTVVRTGPLVVDLGLRVVFVAGQEVILPRLRWELLALLARKPGRWFWSYEIRNALWDDGATDSAVSTLVYRLRRQLGPQARDLIEACHMTGGGLRLRLEPER